jgi:hypothetical protein
MPDEVKEEIKAPIQEPEETVKNDKKKGAIGKLKDKILPDSDEQAAIISTMVRITVLGWSGAILTLNYVSIPGIPQQKIDPTFIASVFTGVLASFGIQTASKKGDGTMKMQNDNGQSAANGGVTKKEMEQMMEKVSAGSVQTIRVEQAPLKIITASDEPPVEPTV